MVFMLFLILIKGIQVKCLFAVTLAANCNLIAVIFSPVLGIQRSKPNLKHPLDSEGKNMNEIHPKLLIFSQDVHKGRLFV